MRTEAAPIVSEYLDRLKLSKLGYRFPGGTLDAEKAEAFVCVADELEKAQADESKKRKRG